MHTPEDGQSTRSIHGAVTKDVLGAPHMPVYNTTTFTFENTSALLDVVEGRVKAGLYTRLGMNPTIFALEETMAAIERSEQALAFCSGMAAATTIFTEYGREGIVCIGDAYGGTIELLSTQLPHLGIDTTFLLGSEIDQLDSFLEAGARLVYFETPTNPNLEVFDIAHIAEVAHRRNALVVVDNTFASPVNQRPLEHGADIVVYSASKNLGGHSDVTGGFIVGPADLLTPLWSWRKNFGSSIAPEAAAMLSRSLRTLSLRVTAQNSTAQSVAEAMEGDSRVARVLYPGLPSFSGHHLAKTQMSGFGGMLTLELIGDGQTTSRVADRLRLFALAPSLGGAESLVAQPIITSHFGLAPKELDRRGITASMLRLSVGLEDTHDLISDLTQALAEVCSD